MQKHTETSAREPGLENVIPDKTILFLKVKYRK